jgi:cytochrome c553
LLAAEVQRTATKESQTGKNAVKLADCRHHPICSFAGKDVQFGALVQGRKRTQGSQLEMKTVVHILGVAAILIGGAVAPSDAAAQSVQELDRSLLFPSNADIADGKSLAADACGDCHRLNGISIDPTFAHLAGQHVIYLYNELLAYQRGTSEVIVTTSR